MCSRHEVDVFKQLLGSFASVLRTGDLDWHQNILQRRQRWDQVESLENESHLATSKLGERIFIHICNGFAVDSNVA